MSDPKYLQQGFNKCLAHFVEECGEALAAAGKIQRWGPYSTNPEIPEAKRETNLRWLLREMNDVSGAIDRLRKTIREDMS